MCNKYVVLVTLATLLLFVLCILFKNAFFKKHRYYNTIQNTGMNKNKRTYNGSVMPSRKRDFNKFISHPFQLLITTVSIIVIISVTAIALDLITNGVMSFLNLSSDMEYIGICGFVCFYFIWMAIYFGVIKYNLDKCKPNNIFNSEYNKPVEYEHSVEEDCDEDTESHVKAVDDIMNKIKKYTDARNGEQ